MTDLEGLPSAVRYSVWVVRQARSFGCLPSAFESEPQATMGHLEHEQMVLEALKRYS